MKNFMYNFIQFLHRSSSKEEDAIFQIFSVYLNYRDALR